MDPSLQRQLTRGASAIGIPLSAGLIESLERYLDLLLLWNQRINLTAVRDAAGIIEKHFLDSLAVVPHIPGDAATLVDVGSGPGFPGAVIALARPALRATLVESNQKKAAFLQALRRELPIPNVTVLAQRAESSAPGTFDVAVSRATLEVPEWLALGSKLVHSGGLVIAMEGSTQYSLPPNCRRLPYPLTGATRALILCST